MRVAGLVLLIIGPGACGSPWAYDPIGTEPMACLSDIDCAQGHCDEASGRCRMCLVDAHCANAARACVGGLCVIAPGRCLSEDDCGLVLGVPRCDVSLQRCVQCLSPVDCGGLPCTLGRCDSAPGCVPMSEPPPTVAVGPLRTSRGEVTAADYARCVEARCCPPRGEGPGCVPAGADRPANCVGHADAVRYCAYAGGRVPSGAEWSSIAGGEASGRFPWGADGMTCERAVVASAGGTACPLPAELPVLACSRLSGRSAEDVCDLAGNLWEWTQESVGGDRRVARGGSFLTSTDDAVRNAFRLYAEAPDRRLVDAGIRCVW
jgi:hypothetical protein